MKISIEGIAELSVCLVLRRAWWFMGCELSVRQSDGSEKISARGRGKLSILLNFMSQITELIHIADRENTSRFVSV